MAGASADIAGEIAPGRAPVPARGGPEASDEGRGPSLTVGTRDLLNFEGRMGLELMVILKQQQEHK